MSFSSTIADAVLRGEESVLAAIAAAPLVVARNNFVERPWGGTRIREHKRLHPLPDQASISGLGIGEAFELAAYSADEEAARFPSRVVFEDGSMLVLAELLARHGERLLGEAFVARHGPHLPLLPKTLDIKELLSVQGHPAGHTEVYIIIDADPGATIAVGFNEDVDADVLRALLATGLERQRGLVDLLREDVDQYTLHNAIARWFADRAADPAAHSGLLASQLRRPEDLAAASGLLAELKSTYWSVLDSLNHIEVRPGLVIYNATPDRLRRAGLPPSAEVHALGNPAGLEVLALEVRLPGPTLRAWDNVRFPQRAVDVDAALGALNLQRTTPEDFIRTEAPIAGRPGVTRSVDCEFFRIEHLRPQGATDCALGSDEPLSLHVLDGSIVLRAADGAALVRLGRGDTALVPAGLGSARVESADGAHVVTVALPGGE